MSETNGGAHGANGKAHTLHDRLAQTVATPFGFHEEEAIISYALDFPELFTSVIHFIEPDHFVRSECRYVMAWILNMYKKFEVIPTRPLLRDRVVRHLKVDDPYKEVLEIIDRKTNPREVSMIKGTIREWAESKQYGLLYSDDAIAAFHTRDYERLREIFDGAARINDAGYKGFWFFDEFQALLDPQSVVHYKTGFQRLDSKLNDGGPSPGEVLIWLAATNVGKCHTLDSKVIEKSMSMVYELEIEDGTTTQLAGYRRVQTARGVIMVCDLVEGDDVQSLLPVE